MFFLKLLRFFCLFGIVVPYLHRNEAINNKSIMVVAYNSKGAVML